MIPQLRFPEFTDEWKIKKTKDIAPLQRGFDLPTSSVIEGEYPVVYSNGILRTHNKFKVKAPGVVTGRSGTIGKVTFVEKDFWPHNTSLWVTDFFENNPKFIYYFYIKFGLNKYNAGSTVPTLNRNDIHSVKKAIPSPSEQTQIANFLTAVDKRIELLKKKKKELEQYKKGIMKKIFSQELRFKQDDGSDFPDWEEKRLGEVCKVQGGFAFKSAEFKETGIPIIRISNISNTNNFIDSSNMVFYNKIDNDENYIVKRGELLIAMSGATTGKTSVFNLENFAYVNQRVGLFKSISEGLFYQYLTQYVRSDKFSNKLSSLLVAGAQPNISSSDIESIKISFPHKLEQQKIANYLSSIDKSIEIVEKEIKQSQEWKKGLLQKMFV